MQPLLTHLSDIGGQSAVTSYTLGGFIHVLLIVAVILAVMQLIQGRRAL